MVWIRENELREVAIVLRDAIAEFSLIKFTFFGVLIIVVINTYKINEDGHLFINEGP